MLLLVRNISYVDTILLAKLFFFFMELLNEGW